jgi:hypothetical protein
MFGLEEELMAKREEEIRRVVAYAKRNCPEHLQNICYIYGHPPIDFTYHGKYRKTCFCGFEKDTYTPYMRKTYRKR